VTPGCDPDRNFLQAAYRQACLAFRKQEVPVGAVVVKENVIIARAHNLKETHQDPTCHAEVLAIQRAAKKLGSWRLESCVLYTTLEPCPMCAAVMVQARLSKVVYGALDPKGGAAESILRLFETPQLNHKVLYQHVDFSDGGRILTQFFQEKRASLKIKACH
jgi:tRNA(adenine34) deaminase